MVLVLGAYLLPTNDYQHNITVHLYDSDVQVDHVMEFIEGFGLLLQAAVTLFIFARF